MLAPAKRSGGRVLSASGVRSLRGLSAFTSIDQFGFSSWLGELGTYNPVFVHPFLQHLMRQSAMPSIALTILESALAERQYLVEEGAPEVEAFHQRWINRVMPQVLRGAPNAVWYGWQPYVIDWSVDAEGYLVPLKFNDFDPLETEALEHEETKAFVGLLADGHRYGLDRAFKLTWRGNWGNHYGEGQYLPCYPYWYDESITSVQCSRYYERSVDPVRIAWARNVAVPTGRANSDGSPEMVDLTELVAEALDMAGDGDSLAVPMGEDGEELVKIDTLDLPDRSDTFLKKLADLRQLQLLATLALPGAGLIGAGNGIASADARISEKLQLRLLEHVSNMPIEAFNETLIPLVHKANRLPGPPPVLRGKAFKREQQEALFNLFKAAMTQPLPTVSKDGTPSGLAYRGMDLLKLDKIARSLDFPINEVSEVARPAADLLPQAPGAGGRPTEPLADPDIESAGDVSRNEARQSGRDR